MAESVAGLLRRRRITHFAATAGRIVGGVPLCFLGAFVLGSLFWFSALMFGWYHHFGWFFLGCAAISIPLLFRLERQTGGRFLTEAVEGCRGGMEFDGAVSVLAMAGSVFCPHAYWLGLAHRAVVSPRTPTAGLVELFLIGPRMILRAARDVRTAWRFRGLDRQLAAGIVRVLMMTERGLPTSDITRRVGQTETPVGPLIWLAYHQVIGLTETGDRAWLPTDIRARLINR